MLVLSDIKEMLTSKEIVTHLFLLIPTSIFIALSFVAITLSANREQL